MPGTVLRTRAAVPERGDRQVNVSGFETGAATRGRHPVEGLVSVATVVRRAASSGARRRRTGVAAGCHPIGAEAAALTGEPCQAQLKMPESRQLSTPAIGRECELAMFESGHSACNF